VVRSARAVEGLESLFERLLVTLSSRLASRVRVAAASLSIVAGVRLDVVPLVIAARSAGAFARECSSLRPTADDARSLVTGRDGADFIVSP
jgi:hypothetical protein